MNETMIQALEMLVQGMLGIFVVLGLIALMVVLMQKLDEKKSQKPDDSNNRQG